jgi:hypothetical protein
MRPYSWSQSLAISFQSGISPNAGTRWRLVTDIQSARVVAPSVAEAMNCSRRSPTVKVPSPCKPSPASTTSRCSAARASALVPWTVRESADTRR